MNNQSKTKVIFRLHERAKYDEGLISDIQDDVEAIFPEEIASDYPQHCLSYDAYERRYMECDPRHVIQATVSADEDAYTKLKSHLENDLGYDLEIVQKLRPEFYQVRANKLALKERKD